MVSRLAGTRLPGGALLFDRQIRRFQAADRDTRLEALLDWSRRLAEVPPRLREAAGGHRVHECQTPVLLWVAWKEGAPGGIAIHADIPRESPTVRGFVALLAGTADGATPAEVAAIPDDLIEQLRLSETLGIMRMQGLHAILQRVKRLTASLAPA